MKDENFTGYSFDMTAFISSFRLHPSSFPFVDRSDASIIFDMSDNRTRSCCRSRLA